MTTRLNILDLFCGIGGFSTGFEFAGHTTIAGVDFDPIALTSFQANHPHAEAHCMDVREFAATVASRYRGVVNTVLASPSCKAYSTANRLKVGAGGDEATAGIAIVEVVRAIEPQFVVVENVRAYIESDTFRSVQQQLEAMGYRATIAVVNAADLGVPQERIRAIARFERDGARELPPPCGVPTTIPGCYPKVEQVGWQAVTADLFDTLHVEQVTDGQSRFLNRFALLPTDRPMLIRRTGINVNTGQPRAGDRPAHTVVALGHNRCWLLWSIVYFLHEPEQGGVWWSGAIFLRPSIEFYARIQTFPDRYKHHPEPHNAMRGIGNAVPPMLSAAIARSLQKL